MTTVGQKIYDLVQSMMMGADISSAKTGHINKVYPMEGDPGLVGSIDQELAKTSGGTTIPGKPKSQQAMEKKFRDFMSSLEPDGTVAGPNNLQQLLTKQLGVAGARNAMQMLINPKGAIARVITSKNLFGGAGGKAGVNMGTAMKAGGIVALYWALINSDKFVMMLTRKLTVKGGIWDKTFRNKTNTLNNQFRTRQQQESIRGGFTQVIITTNAGTTDPRDAYNSLYEKVHDESMLSNMNNIRLAGNNVP